MDKVEEFLATLKSTILSTAPDSSLILSDRDGFVLGKLIDKNDSADKIIENSALSIFSTSTDQASKLYSGKNKAIVSYFEDRIVVHINVTNVILSIVTDTDSNVGVILGAQNDIVRSLNNLSNSIQIDLQDM
ncbi:hypothetical protein CYY_002907 [Polysphondylium violaceum]|uniref:Uncharacterized protein n=1 Tax=Polysphondylium violaceum TaxID=133409 RepID=A0A8J4Q0X1_9MYCE|nr:hypothetical protein CYY_002907 [Polysphondylium violaceum]